MPRVSKRSFQGNRKIYWLLVCCTWVFGLAVGTGIVALTFYQLNQASVENDVKTLLSKDIGVLPDPKILLSGLIFSLRFMKIKVKTEKTPKSFMIYTKKLNETKDGDSSTASDLSEQGMNGEPAKDRKQNQKLNDTQNQKNQKKDEKGFQLIKAIDYEAQDPLLDIEPDSKLLLVYKVQFEDGELSNSSNPITLEPRDKELRLEASKRKLSLPSITLVSSDEQKNMFSIQSEDVDVLIFELQYNLAADTEKTQIQWKNKVVKMTKPKTLVDFLPDGDIMALRVRAMYSNISEDPSADQLASEWSETIFSSKYKASATVPSHVVDLKMMSTSDTSASINWKSASDNGEIITGYTVTLRDRNDKERIFPVDKRSTKKYLLTDLEPSTEYTVGISAKNRIGSGPSVEIDFTTQECQTAPPRRFDAHVVGTDAVVLAWTPPETICGNPTNWEVVNELNKIICVAKFGTNYCEAVLGTEDCYRRLKIRSVSSTGFGKYSQILVVPQPVKGKCNNVNDRMWNVGAHDGGYAMNSDSTKFEKKITSCGYSTSEAAVKNCLRKYTSNNPVTIGGRTSQGLTAGCMACYAGSVSCGSQKCASACVFLPCSEKCQNCMKQNCLPDFFDCGGFTEESKWKCV